MRESTSEQKLLAQHATFQSPIIILTCRITSLIVTRRSSFLITTLPLQVIN